MSQLKRSPLKRGGFLARQGQLSIKWADYRNLKALKDRDEEGLLSCQEFRLGLPRCGVARPSLDLHHIQGRDAAPDKYFDETNLVWLTRSCHEAVHNGSVKP